MSKQIREIRVRDLVCYYYLTLIALVIIISGFILIEISFGNILIRLSAIPIFLVLLYITLRYHVIGCILMYKAYAPLEIRDKCRFEPTCSTYMIQAINKYGLIRGVIKGIKRIRRCKPPNGGIDLP